jgi:hypothetical protein
MTFTPLQISAITHNANINCGNCANDEAEWAALEYATNQMTLGEFGEFVELRRLCTNIGDAFAIIAR